MPAMADASVEADALYQHAAAHFVKCNELLDAYDERSLQLRCPIVDVRPEATDCRPALDALTTAALRRHTVAGDHWTMLFGEQTRAVAALVEQTLHEFPAAATYKEPSASSVRDAKRALSSCTIGAVRVGA
jgi:hypothetical protein